MSKYDKLIVEHAVLMTVMYHIGKAYWPLMVNYMITICYPPADVIDACFSSELIYMDLADKLERDFYESSIRCTFTGSTHEGSLFVENKAWRDWDRRHLKEMATYPIWTIPMVEKYIDELDLEDDPKWSRYIKEYRRAIKKAASVATTKADTSTKYRKLLAKDIEKIVGSLAPYGNTTPDALAMQLASKFSM